MGKQWIEPHQRGLLWRAWIAGMAVTGLLAGGARTYAESPTQLDAELRQLLTEAGFTGTVEASLPVRLGRPLDSDKIEVGRLLFFDNILGLHNDNSCAGCHSPAFAFGDSQPIAIGVDNNGMVGPGRAGPRNQRRAPSVVNTAFYPALMWTARFVARSGDPFDNALGFQFPSPEHVITATQTLLQAQGSLPSTELPEMAGFTGITANPGPTGPLHQQFDNGQGEPLPAPDATGFHNFPIQEAVDARLNAIGAYLPCSAARSTVARHCRQAASPSTCAARPWPSFKCRCRARTRRSTALRAETMTP